MIPDNAVARAGVLRALPRPWQVAWVLGVVAMALIAVLPALLDPVRHLPDDAWYYQVIARALLDGDGPRFDGVEPSTGMHPLWQGFAVLAVAVGGDGLGPTRVLMLVGLAAAALALWLVVDVARRWVGDARWALLLAAPVAGNAWWWCESVNGLETGLATAVLMVVLHGLLTGARSRWLVVGAGLAVLARSDLAVVLGVVAVAMWWGGDRRRALAMVIGLAAAVAVISVWCWSVTGSWTQSSAMAVPDLFHAHWRLAHPGAPWWAAWDGGWPATAWILRFLGWSAGPLVVAAVLVVVCMPGCLRGAPGLAQAGSGPGSAGALAGMGCVEPAGAPAPPGPGMDRCDGAGRILVAWALGLGLLLLIHGGLRWYPRSWYVLSLLPCMALLLAWGWRGLPHRRWWPVGVAAVAVLGGVLSWWSPIRDPLPWQAAMRDAGLRVRELPPSALPGAFNAGLVAWFAGRPVVNLDGVVNEGAAQAIRTGTVGPYIARRGITHVVDFPAMWGPGPFPHAMGPWFGDDTAARLQPGWRHPQSGLGWPRPDQAIQIMTVLPPLAAQPAAPGGGPLQRGASAAWLGPGWGGIEVDAAGSAWVWALGTRAELRPPMTGTGSATVSLRLAAFPGLPRPLRLTIAGGSVVQAVELGPDPATIVVLGVPVGGRLLLEMDQAVRPSAIHAGSRDDRALSLRLLDMRWEPTGWLR